MGILKEIYAALSNLHDAIEKDKPFDDAKVKTDIIQKSIYGVDLESGAVDIARLRFWLALVVDENEPKPLPNLDYKIMQGNSLLEKFEEIPLGDLMDADQIVLQEQSTLDFGDDYKTDFTLFDRVTQNQIKTLLDKFFNPNDWEIKHGEKVNKEVIKNRINEIVEGKIHAKIYNEKQTMRNSVKEFETKYKIKNETDLEKLNTKSKEFKKYRIDQKRLNELDGIETKLIDIQHTNVRPYFLWHLFFADVFNKGGFDIVIGNPPYIKEYTKKSVFDGLRSSPYYMGKMDIWYFFACFCIDVLKDNGIQCFIAQNNWVTSAGAARLRDKVITETEMLSFIDFGNYKVFQSAGIQTMIYVLKKTEQPREQYTTEYSKLLVDNIDKAFLDYFLQADTDVEHDNFEKLEFQFVPQNYADGYITFANDTTGSILTKIQKVEHIKLTNKEVAQGIVPNPDVVNSRNIKKFSDSEILERKISLRDGVFVTNKGNFDDLPQNEKKYIKPIFEPNEVDRYKFVQDYDSEILYITKANYQDDAPNLLDHLSKYRNIMNDRRENRNGRLDYFHLHWPRDEYFFEQGNKILSVRKCGRPTFIYTSEPTYVMMSFNIIKSERLNLKFLTALLNSKLIAFWLRHKGKMQGNNYQIDKAPLVNIPIVQTDQEHILATLVDYILLLHQPQKEEFIKYIGNDLIIHSIEEVIDQAIYELYFGSESEFKELKVLQHLQHLTPLSGDNTDEDVKTVVKFYHWLHEQRNPIRNILLKANIVSKNIVGEINASIS